VKTTGQVRLEEIIRKVPVVVTVIIAILMATSPELSASSAILVPAGANWKYLDNGSDQGAAWRASNFNDSTWSSGRAQLGYGDNDETTTLLYGGNSNNKFITTYFRHAFNVPNAALYTNVTISLLRDDGAVVYLNGREVIRNNLPAGAINYRTLASANVSGAGESAFSTFTIAATNLVSGSNVLAVEIHQVQTNSTDISFDLQLAASGAPIMITPVAPSQNANSVNAPANLTVALDNVTSSNVAVTIYGRQANPLPGPDFTIIAMPDTQYYVSSLNGGRPETFTAQTDWIVNQKSARNIAFVTHLGDCVENGDNGGNPAEWLVATNAMYRLENPQTTLAEHGIPYGIAVGNHDQSPFGQPGGTVFYNQFFGEAHFSGRSYYGGHYGTNNNNHYQLFSASGLDFIIVHIEFDPAQNTNVLGWANGLLQSFHNRRAIVVSHSILSVSGSFSAQGQKIYDSLKMNANLFLMLSGHDPGEARRTDTFNGNTVHTLVSDYQGRTNGGSGFLRLLEFSPSNNVIRVKTYSTTFNQFETDSNSQFTLDYDMGAPFTALASFSNVCTATNLSTAWAGLDAGVKYEWCVRVCDGPAIQTGPMWEFTTAIQAPSLAPATGAISYDRSTHSVNFSWPTTVGSVYQLVYRDNIAAAEWLPYSQEITASSSVLGLSTPVDPNVPARFFALKFVR
jgi:hypothetical protein